MSGKKHQTKKAELAGENDGSDESEGSEGSTCQCPVCGLVYGEEDTLWICCDGCDCWYDLKCTSLRKCNPCIPEYYWCESYSRVSEVYIATCACTSCTCPHINMCCQLVLSQVDMSLLTCTVSRSSCKLTCPSHTCIVSWSCKLARPHTHCTASWSRCKLFITVLPPVTYNQCS